jgi:hypothetical protein
MTFVLFYSHHRKRDESPRGDKYGDNDDDDEHLFVCQFAFIHNKMQKNIV